MLSTFPPGTRPEHIASSLFFLRKHPTVICLGKRQMPWKRPKAHATCITRGPEKGGLGVAQRPHGRALYKGPDTGRRKQNPDKLYKDRKKDTKKRKRKTGRQCAAKLQGRQEHCRLKVTRRTAGKGAATKTSTKAGNIGHRTDKGAKTKERTQS